MGCDHYFYILPLLTYTKFIRPKLIECYGPISRYAILSQEQRKKQYGDLKQSIHKGNLASFLMGNKLSEVKNTPFEKFFNDKKCPEYFGTESYKLQTKINDLLESKSIYQYEDRNHFIRTDRFLSYNDLFEQLGLRIRVSNMIQVENFIKYIEAVEKAYGGESMSQSLVRQYDNCSQAGQVFKEVLEKMKSTKKETVLVLKSSG